MQDKILIVGPSWVGDMVMAQVLFKILKKHDPEAQIDVMAPAWSAPIVSRMKEVSKHITMPVGHGSLELGTRYKLGKDLAKSNYTHAYVLPNSFKSALIPFWAKIPKRTGFKGEMRFGVLNDLRGLNKKRLPLMIQRFAALGFNKAQTLPESLPKPTLTVNPDTLKETLKAKHLSTSARVLALCPGAEFGSSKRWPIASYAKVANYFIEKGMQVWIFGSEKDFEVADEINQACKQKCVNLAGKTTLSEACDLLSVASGVVTNDSGLMHIAAALNRPLVAVYGSSSPHFTPPLGDKIFIHKNKLPCSPCFKRECPLKHHECMTKLETKPVIEALEEWLG